MHVVRALQTGGMENVVRRLLVGLDPNRFQQTVCTLIATPDATSAGTLCLNRPADRPAFLVPQLRRIFSEEQPDIVHSRNWAAIEAIAAAKLAGVSVVVHSEHGRDIETMKQQPLRRRILRRLSRRWTDRMFCVSQELRDYYCREMDLPATALDVIPNGVDTEEFEPDLRAQMDVRAQLSVRPETLVVGTVSRLDPVKDHLTLLEAAGKALHKGLDLQLVIIGDGPQRPAIQEFLASRPLLRQRTLLTGEIHNVAQWLNGLDVFVLPSLSEGLSNTLLEAMAVGVPPVATAIGGNSEVVEQRRSGILVAPRDVDSISECLLELATARAWRLELGRNARERIVAHFSLARMLQRYDQMYSELVERHRLHSRARNLGSLN
jgi:sugar transferase (PEP-CTERM/EpsH1 system associated)